MSDLITHRGYRTTEGWYATCCEREFNGPLGTATFTDTDELVTCPAFVFAPIDRDMPEKSPIWLRGRGEDFQKLTEGRAERTRLRETRELALKYASLMVPEDEHRPEVLLAYATEVEAWLTR